MRYTIVIIFTCFTVYCSKTSCYRDKAKLQDDIHCAQPNRINSLKDFKSGCLGQDTECFDNFQEAQGLKFLANGTMEKTSIFPVLEISERLFFERGKWLITEDHLKFETECFIAEEGECYGACLYERKQSQDTCIQECGLSDRLKDFGKLDMKLICKGDIIFIENRLKVNLLALDIHPVTGFKQFSKNVTIDNFCLFKLK